MHSLLRLLVHYFPAQYAVFGGRAQCLCVTMKANATCMIRTDSYILRRANVLSSDSRRGIISVQKSIRMADSPTCCVVQRYNATDYMDVCILQSDTQRFHRLAMNMMNVSISRAFPWYCCLACFFAIINGFRLLQLIVMELWDEDQKGLIRLR